MISESLQEQAALFALGLLDAAEVKAFEGEMAADPDLSRLTFEFGEAAAALALTAAADQSLADALPKPELKVRILHHVAVRTSPPVAVPLHGSAQPRSGRDRSFLFAAAAAALVLFGCSLWLGLALKDARLANVQLADELRMSERARIAGPADALSRYAFCALEPTEELSKQPRAAVIWDPKQRRGVLRVNKLPPPASGKDYQLWAVEEGSKQPVSAGVVRLDEDGNATLPFRPDSPEAGKVTALAISLERAGGSKTKLGPIFLVGKF
jgi:anti-sigma-K factor RskA